MKIDKIINKTQHDLDNFVLINKEKYLNADPFPHIIIENFFNNNFLDEILRQFPNLSDIKKTTKYQNKNEVKFGNNEYEKFPEKIKILFDFLNSNFLNFLQNITSIKEKLIADKELNGGMHEIKKGGLLKYTQILTNTQI